MPITEPSASEDGNESEDSFSKPEKRTAINLKNNPYGLVHGVKKGSSDYSKNLFIRYSSY